MAVSIGPPVHNTPEETVRDQQTVQCCDQAGVLYVWYVCACGRHYVQPVDQMMPPWTRCPRIYEDGPRCAAYDLYWIIRGMREADVRPVQLD